MSAGAPGGGAGAGAVVRQGHLRKLKTMKKKYFVLRAETKDCSARLEYYESEKKFRSGAAPRRVLPLKTCYNITRRLDLKQKHVIALFTREEQFCIVAENEKDLHDWLTAILKQHGCDDASEELLHPIQHVWQVNVQKKGLGASKNIQGLYNLCLTDKTLTLVKIKSQNNVISDLGIPERIEYSLKNIRRCGDSECFFYMEVGRQTSTGAGELWMHSDDSNIAQSMHSTILLAMKNCAKMSENERDHIIMPKGSLEAPNRRATYSADGNTKLSNEKGLCVGSCIRQCVCSTVPYSVEDSAATVAPVTPNNAENQPPNNTLITDKPETTTRVIKHHRTVSLPTGCSIFQEPLKIVHERTRSAPLTGDEVDRVTIEKSVTHSSCKAVNGTETFPAKKTQWSRRASTGTRLSKLSPAHTKNASIPRHRCESMPSRASSSFETERPTPRHNDHTDGVDGSRDETDAMVEWYRTPRIPEEPDSCDVPKDFMSPAGRASAVGALPVQHSRTSSLGVEEEPRGYLPMGPLEASGLISASSGSVCSGTPSTDPRFSEYQLEPATSHIAEGERGERPPRAYSVGSRPMRAEPPRHRAYSVGHAARPRRAAPASAPPASADDLMELDFSGNSTPATPASPAHHKVVVARTPPSTIGFHERHKPAVDEYVDMSPRNAGYVEMRPGSPPAPPPAPPAPLPPPPPAAAPATPDGYVEMNYTRAPSRTSTGPIAIAPRVPLPGALVNALPPSLACIPPLGLTPPDEPRRRPRAPAPAAPAVPTPHGSQTLFPLSLDSPASPPELDDAADISDDDAHEPSGHPLSTVREISEEGRRSPGAGPAGAGVVGAGAAGQSPAYVRLARPCSRPIAAPAPPPGPAPHAPLPGNPTATKTIRVTTHNHTAAEGTASVVVAGCTGAAPARFVVESPPPPPAPLSPLGHAPLSPLGPAPLSPLGPAPLSPLGPAPLSPLGPAPPLNYAALDLEPRRAPHASPLRTYTQIDFVRSEKLHADAT